MSTPEMLHMLIAKLGGGLMDRWHRTIYTIRKKYYWEPDLQDLIRFVEKGTVLMNDRDLLFSREALHEYIMLIKFSPYVSQEMEELLQHD